MLNRIRALTRQKLATVLAAALLGATLMAPSPAANQPAGRSCDPNTEACITHYIFYEDYTLTTIVGTGRLDCDSVYTQDTGYQTIYFDENYMHCPY